MAHGPRKKRLDFGDNPDHVIVRVSVMIVEPRHTREDCVITVRSGPSHTPQHRRVSSTHALRLVTCRRNCFHYNDLSVSLLSSSCLATCFGSSQNPNSIDNGWTSSSSDRVDSRGPLRQPRVATTTSLGPFGTKAEGCTIADLQGP